MKTIFLSYSHQDILKTAAIKSFLDIIIENVPELKGIYDVFYAHQTIRDKTKWRDSIVEAINGCYCFVPFLTPSAIDSRWMHFEGGLSSQGNNRIAPLATKNIDYDRLIFNEHSINHIFDITKTQGASNDYYAKDDNDILSWLEVIFPKEILSIRKWRKTDIGKSSFLKFRYKIHENRIYIVGSRPEKLENDDNGWNENVVSSFVRDITNTILTRTNFHVASSPTVENVGGVVLNSTYNSTKDLERYHITGLFKLERAVTEGVDDSAYLSKWKTAINRHRKEYLSIISTYIIIGGNKNTIDEYNVATEFSYIRILPLPCFGGASRDIFNYSLNAEVIKELPCFKCSYKDTHYNPSCRLKQEFLSLINTFIVREGKSWCKIN